MENLCENKKFQFIDNRYISAIIFVISLTYILIFNGMLNVNAAEVIKNNGLESRHICLGPDNADYSYSDSFQSNDINVCVCGHNFCGQLGTCDTNRQGLALAVQAHKSNVKQIMSKYRTIFYMKRDIIAWITGYNCFGKCGIGKECHCRPIPTIVTKLTQFQKATNAVVKAETSKKQTDVIIAQSLVNDLLASADKTNLNNRLINLRNSINLAIAEDAVLKVGESLKQIDFEHAKFLVDEVLSSTDKDSMLNQLFVFQTLIDTNNATNLVIKAEESKKQIDVARAKDLVNTLPDSTDVTSLLNRLVKVQDDIDLINATNAVINAETSKQQVDIIIATSLVNDLPNSVGKTDLASRLAVVQKNINKEMSLTNVISTVIKAEESKVQEEVDKARNLVNALPEIAEKVRLLDRLVVVQNAIDLTNAENAVTKAEESKQQLDVDRATSLVNALTALADKTDLSNRLGAVQKIINEEINLTNAKCAVVKAEETKRQEDIDLAMRLANALPEYTEKTSLLNRLASVQNEINKSINLNNAISAVVNAETSKQQIDVDKAIKLVNTLSDPIDKINLLDRLTIVQNNIDLTNATNVVVKAEQTKQQVDVSIAISLVNALPDSAEKTSLLNRLASVQNEINKSTDLANAISSVVNAETTKQQGDVNKAISLVKILSESTDKNNLLDRLVNVQNNIDLTNATNTVAKAEESKQQSYVDRAMSLVNSLPDSVEKASLLSRLANVQNEINKSTDLTNAISAVTKAEESKQQVDVDRAKSLVNTLPDSAEKNSLLNRLASVQNYIDKSIDLINATDAVDKAETTKQQIDVDKAKSLIIALLDSTEKTNLLGRLAILQNSIDLNNATNAVVKAEESKQQVEVDKSISLVKTLPDSAEKTSLLNRLASVQNEINKSINLTNAISAVVNAETSKQQIDVDKAINLVNTLSDPIDKTNLLDRLTIVQNNIDLTNATNVVVKAEQTKQQVDVSIAKSLVNALLDSAEKTSLLNRLASVQNEINKSTDLANAISAVVNAETSEKQIDVDKAKSLVNSLLDSIEKTNLLDRLVVVQNYIDLINAKGAVIEAEGSKIQADVDRAMSLVNLLVDATEKIELSNRLAKIQSSIDYEISLDNAVKAVIRAEASNLQWDVDRATALVKALSDSTDKTNLLNRLAVVQNIMDDPVIAVEKAETTKLQADVDRATTLVNHIQNSEDKLKLQDRLTTVQDIIDLNNATKAVITAEDNNAQLYVDKASVVVNNLKDSAEKINLIKRLTVVQEAINLNNVQIAVTNAEASLQQADLDMARSLATALPSGAEKINLLNRLVNVQNSINLVNARIAVNIAEGSKLQADLDTAENLVNILPNTINKTSLLIRLVTLKSTIDLANATNAVSKAEATKVQADVDAAKVLVIALSDSTSRTSLVDRLTTLQASINLTNAINAVSKVEATKTQADADIAKVLVSDLPSSTTRTNLLNRLSVVQSDISLTSAISAVSKAEATKAQADIDIAKSLVNVLPASTLRTNLLDRLVILQSDVDLNNAINAVSKVEATKTQADLDIAKSLVNLLPSSTTRTAFLDRLAIVESDINLTASINAVSKAEVTKTQADVDTAKTLVITLPISIVRTALLDRLAIVQSDITLTNAVNGVLKVEATKTQADLDIAKTLVNVLPTSTVRTNLLDRLAIVQNSMNLINATNAVSKAEATKQQADVDIAKSLVIALPTNTDRVTLLNRLINVQNMIDVTNATNAVTKAEGSKLQTDVDGAMILVNALTSSTAKTNLLSRLVTVQYNINLTNATNTVVKAESTKAQADIDLAQSYINKLPLNDTNRTQLQQRLDIAKA
ncbi:hypothetical protein [Clostridium cellulovorans]|uniref:Uncharacterized protein n=1 Tax=Clostridium cellulovorans (strain ATCC 35296 / DSM 3052 / OCM 3 / 743B) TaxID=573061 RepID=D9SVD6_CLOC7|nr:hypothetical protein [Clostridium cellulovorans]ADL51060.1 hypothetical protein Clocel_1306 [Clostridium cellulovorans 743B]